MDQISHGRARSFLLRSAVAGLAGLLAGSLLITTAAAQTGLPVATTQPSADPPPPPAAPPERTIAEKAIIEAAIRLYKIKADLQDVEKSMADTTTKLAAAAVALAETEKKLADARALLADIRSKLQARAAVVYQRHSDRLGMALSVDRVVDLSAGNHYAESVASVDNGEIDRLNALISALEIERTQRENTRRDLADTKAKLTVQQVTLAAQADKEATEIDKLGGVPVMGTSFLTAAEVAAWFKSTGRKIQLSGSTTIDELSEMYVSEGAAENVRGDIAFAQAIIETGSFGHAIDNNYAGIGACDSCTTELLFPSPQQGVRAQIQLLRNYADPTSRADRLANPPDATIYGTDPARAAFSYDTFFAKGRAPVWNIMGAGNWATDPLYAGKVLAVYQTMLEFKTKAPKPGA